MAATKAPARKAGPVRASTFRVGTGAQASRASAITSPTGGATTDTQARAAIDAIITVLENFGMVTPN